jgi:glycogen synthase
VRILAVANRYPPWSVGGYEGLAASAVRALRSAGHRVRVLTTAPDPSDLPASGGDVDPDVARDLRWYWREHRFPALGPRATLALERDNARALSRHLTELRPDVVLWWAMGGMSLSLLEQVRRVGVPGVGVVGDDWIIYGPRVDAWTRWFSRRRGAVLAPLAERVTGIPTEVSLASSARWIFISEYLRVRALGERSAMRDSTVAHPGVDPELFGPAQPRPWSWRLLYCGRLDPRKGVATAIEALAELPAEARLTIDGEGDARFRSELVSLASRLEVQARVQFQHSPRERVAEVYAAADAVVFPVTWEEPWGLVPLEAMAIGRPVVASDAGGGVAEYLRAGENCLQFPPRDASALAAALRQLADRPELRKGLIARGRATAARFTDQQFNDALARELEHAVAMSSAPLALRRA